MVWRARLGVLERSVGRPSRARQDRFRRGRPVPESTVRLQGVVVPPPSLDQHLGLLQRMKDFPVEQLIAQLAFERFIVPVLPWAAALDEQRAHADPLQPGANDLDGELAAIIRPDVAGGPRSTNRSVSACSMSSEVSRRATTIARHSRMWMSTTVRMRKGRPSEVRSCTKS